MPAELQLDELLALLEAFAGLIALGPLSQVERPARRIERLVLEDRHFAVRLGNLHPEDDVAKAQQLAIVIDFAGLHLGVGGGGIGPTDRSDLAHVHAHVERLGVGGRHDNIELLLVSLHATHDADGYGLINEAADTANKLEEIALRGL